MLADRLPLASGLMRSGTSEGKPSAECREDKEYAGLRLFALLGDRSRKISEALLLFLARSCLNDAPGRTMAARTAPQT